MCDWKRASRICGTLEIMRREPRTIHLLGRAVPVLGAAGLAGVLCLLVVYTHVAIVWAVTIGAVVMLAAAWVYLRWWYRHHPPPPPLPPDATQADKERGLGYLVRYIVGGPR